MAHCNTLARIVNGLHEVTRLYNVSAILPRCYDPHNVIQDFPEFPDVNASELFETVGYMTLILRPPGQELQS